MFIDTLYSVLVDSQNCKIFKITIIRIENYNKGLCVCSCRIIW